MNDLDTTRALVTLEDARAYVWRDENDGSRDALLVDAINLVSGAIWTYTEREFLPTDGATRSFLVRRRQANGSWVGWIDLAPYDLRSATTLTLYADTDAPEELDTTEYRLRPVGAALGGTYLYVLTVDLSRSEEQPGFGWEATIDGDWGMSAVPEDVKLAALQWIDNIAKNPGSYASVEMSGFVVAPELDQAVNRAGMPASVRHRLRPFCRSI